MKKCILFYRCFCIYVPVYSLHILHILHVSLYLTCIFSHTQYSFLHIFACNYIILNIFLNSNCRFVHISCIFWFAFSCIFRHICADFVLNYIFCIFCILVTLHTLWKTLIYDEKDFVIFEAWFNVRANNT